MITWSLFITGRGRFKLKRLRPGFKIGSQIVKKNTDGKLGKYWKLVCHVQAPTRKKAARFVELNAQQILRGIA